MPDELRSAYAVLGLEPGASLHKVKRQFKTLVRRWHPDRFTNDPQGRAEANDRLRVINNAYSTILQTRFGDAATHARREPAPARPSSDRAAGGHGAFDPAAARAKAEQPSGAAEATPPPVGPPLTRGEIDALIDSLRGYRKKKSIREQIVEDPWNRGLSLVLVGVYILVDAAQTWRHPWPRIAMRGLRPVVPGTGSILASVIGSVLWTLPLLWVIWYADGFSKRIAWLFLAIFALLLPFFSALMRI
jgi:hypothetical protein